MNEANDTQVEAITAAAPRLAPAPTRQVKSPGTALVLAFIFPGLGQIYNGQLAKALTVFGLWLAGFWATVQGEPIPFVFFMAFAYLYGLVDAYRTAESLNQSAAGLSSDEPVAESPAWGITLIALGLVLLANNLGWFRLADFQRFWPVLLIVAGALFVRSSLAQRAKAGQEAGGAADSGA